MKLCCMFFTREILGKCGLINKYFQCQKCGKKSYKSTGACYQPLDWKWLNDN